MFFNAGSTLALDGDNIYILGTAGMNTMLAGASGGLTVFTLHACIHKNTNNRFSLIQICNGNLAGLVAITGYLLIKIHLKKDHVIMLRLGQLC
jgi:Amt family ammonium transporter